MGSRRAGGGVHTAARRPRRADKPLGGPPVRNRPRTHRTRRCCQEKDRQGGGRRLLRGGPPPPRRLLSRGYGLRPSRNRPALEILARGITGYTPIATQ
ncbi:Hypothetical protein NTJ_15535 [Nesidiocoris tenuis]|uniref:Uncharacterized protein n=1 Tax=Nesidiocoris tenuis TaxID=355587 RepID=A0ABN7BEB4_9HEMI|nr:Hypothetical protein NTJ_15535 [Nesidiocoris tenuis]